MRANGWGVSFFLWSQYPLLSSCTKAASRSGYPGADRLSGCLYRAERRKHRARRQCRQINRHMCQLMYPHLFPRANRQDYEQQLPQQIYPRHIPQACLSHQVLLNLQMVNLAVREVIAAAEYVVQMEKMELSASQLFSAGGSIGCWSL